MHGHFSTEVRQGLQMPVLNLKLGLWLAKQDFQGPHSYETIMNIHKGLCDVAQVSYPVGSS